MTYLEPGWSVLAVFVMLVLVYKNVSRMQAARRPRDILKKLGVKVSVTLWVLELLNSSASLRLKELLYN